MPQLLRAGAILGAIGGGIMIDPTKQAASLPVGVMLRFASGSVPVGVNSEGRQLYTLRTHVLQFSNDGGKTWQTPPHVHVGVLDEGGQV